MHRAMMILIADRNPRVRQLIKRELGTCGYRSQLVRNGEELIRALNGPQPIHLLILDPGFPGMEVAGTVRKIIDRAPQLPVVLYCLGGTDSRCAFTTEDVIRVDKDGSSIETLKSTVNKILSSAPMPDPVHTFS